MSDTPKWYDAHLPEFQKIAYINSMDEYQALYQRSIENPDGFWAEQADKYLAWGKKWDSVLKYDFENHKPTKIIDTVGLCISRGGRTKDSGQGHEDKGQFDEEKEVFGISGACPLYRREALEDAKYKDEYFDEDFFMYKEDVDLSWRLQLLGYKFLYYPKALAFHGRGTGVIKRDSVRETFKNRKRLSKFQRTYSFRNHHLMLFKNLTPWNYIKNFFHLATRNTASLIYALVYEPFVLKSLVEYFKLLPKMARKRRHLMKKKRAKSSRINRFMKA